MPVKTHIESPATGDVADVTQNSLRVIQYPSPPRDLGNVQDVVPFQAYFTTSAGSSDMIVDGSTTPVDFSVRANTDSAQNRDRYIANVSVLLSDAGLEAGLFGALATLANGLDFEFFDPAVGVITINDAITRNIDFIRTGLGTPAVATSGTNEPYVITKVSAAPTKAEAYLINIDMRETFGLPNGLRLPAGSASRLTFRVNDALAGLVEFNIIAYGFEHLL